MTRKILAHYEIIEPLGRGGMGEVYRARDTKLERNVAIKILPPEMAANRRSLERFQLEAKLVAGLNHPGIVTLHSVEEHEGVRFLTMELVEGRSLSQELGPEGVQLELVLDIGCEIAEALAAAHEQGIIHRDLKPANVMLTPEGRVKILDFGLAKLNEEIPPRQGKEIELTRTMGITQDGVTVGTVPYMAPEQLRFTEADKRSDLFSLGILLFEMATGEPPFQGHTNVDVTSSILRDKPPPLARLKPNLPPHLGRIVARCLEKNPDKRYQSAREIQLELQALKNELTQRPGAAFRIWTGLRYFRYGSRSIMWRTLAATVLAVVALGAIYLSRTGPEGVPDPTGGQTGMPSPSATAMAADNSIAVLPFVNLTADPGQEFISDGIAEELLNLLARIPQLQVAARTSSFSFKGKDLAIPEIGRRLNVAHILEGGIRMSGDRIRITTQLVQTDNGFNIWSDSFDFELGDVFAIQDKIAADVVQQLKVELLRSAPTVPVTDPIAYTLFLQGRYQARLGTTVGFAQSVVLLRKALEIDATYARAWSELARVYGNQAGVGLIPSAEGYGLSREAAEKALALEPRLASAHGRLAWIAMFHDRDLARAARHLERGLELAPVNNDLLRNAATLVKYLGRLEDAIAIGEFAVSRDPVNPTGYSNLGFACYYAGRPEQAMVRFRKTLDLSPHRIAVRYYIGALELDAGNYQAALEITSQEKYDLFRLVGLVMIHHALGNKQDSDETLAELIADYPQDAAYNIAYTLAFRGEADRAFTWLEKAAEYRDPGLGDVMIEPRFRNLHDDPRWLPFLSKLGKAPAQLDAIEFRAPLPR